MKAYFFMAAAFMFILSCGTKGGEGLIAGSGNGRSYDEALSNATIALYRSAAKQVSFKAIRSDIPAVERLIRGTNAIRIMSNTIVHTVHGTRHSVDITMDRESRERLNLLAKSLMRDGFIDENTVRAYGMGTVKDRTLMDSRRKYLSREAALMTAKAKLKVLLAQRYPGADDAVQKVIAAAEPVSETFDGERFEIILELKIPR
ncbi:MAG: hypothetical protein AABZ39_06885 [Spirochaetota bacterium]